ncbi:hypothetical protein [Nostoc sp. UHCC 0251]|nr:hypothetical protein [Nostoc sp. UHCC 0251]
MRQNLHIEYWAYLGYGEYLRYLPQQWTIARLIVAQLEQSPQLPIYLFEQ